MSGNIFFDKRYAFVMGIQEYDEPLPDLEKTRNDASEINKLFHEFYRFDKTVKEDDVKTVSVEVASLRNFFFSISKDSEPFQNENKQIIKENGFRTKIFKEFVADFSEKR